MLFDALVLGLLIGWWRGGSLARLVGHDFRGVWLIPVAFVVQRLILPLQAAGRIGHSGGYWLLMGSYALLVLVVLLNSRSGYLLLAGVGLAMNICVIALNGAMPVSLDLVRRFSPADLSYVLERQSYLHVPLTAATKLPWFGDVVAWPMLLPRPRIMIISIGDILLSVGLMLFIQAAMQYPAVSAGFAVGRPPQETPVEPPPPGTAGG